MKPAGWQPIWKAWNPQTWPAVCIGIFLVLAVLAVFGQTAGFGFVNYDDGKYVYENPVVQKGLTWQGALWASTYGGIGHWHPLTWLTHMADWQMYGSWAGGPHLTHVALHAVTTVLLFLLLRKMTGALWRSAFVAAVFAVHPLRAESVAWIAERKDVLSGMFFMLTLWAYLYYVRQPSRGRYAVMAVLFGLGLLSKNMLVTLPLVLLLLDWWPLERFPISNFQFPIFLRLLKEKIPLLLLSAGSCVATALVPEQVEDIDRVSFLARVGNALVSYVVYLRQMIFPAGLANPYPNIPNGPPKWEVVLAFVLLPAISAVVLVCRKKRPFLLTGWLWYLGMLVPTIGLVQISYYAHADRYTYLPEIGLAIAGTWAVADWSAGWKHRRMVLGGLMIATVGALAVCGGIQTSYWHDSESLWTHTLACTSSNIFARNNLGTALVQKGDLDDGIVQFQKALEIDPDDVGVHNNLGTALVQKGDLDDGIAHFRKAMAIKPDHVGARNNLGNALARRGDLAEAIAQYQEALKINPRYEDAYCNLGSVFVKNGKWDEAIAQYQKAEQINPDYAAAYFSLGDLFLKQGKPAEAVVQYELALKIKPDDASARNNLGNVLAQQEDLAGAIVQYQKALALQPNLPSVRDNLGHALLRTGDFDGAMACFQKITDLGLEPLARWYNLGNNFLQKQDLQDAIICYQQAVKINPRFADAYARLGVVFFKKGNIKEAGDAWQQSLAIDPNQVYVQNNLAWLLATTPDASLRNGTKAVALATQADQLSGGGNPMVLRTLAAACAEEGNYALATTTARRGLKLALEQKNGSLAATLQKDIKLYEAGAPMRETP